MFLATIFALLSLLTFVLTVIGFIKPSIVLKNKEMKWKRLKIGASGMLSCFVLLILSAIFAPEQDIHPEEENQNQQQASTQTASQEQAPKASSDNKAESAKPVVTIYDSAAKCLEKTNNYSIEDGTLKVISPKEFVLTRKVLPMIDPDKAIPIFDPDIEKLTFRIEIVFILLNTFAHTNLDELTLHIKSEFINSPHMEPQNNLPDLNLYQITLHAKRKDVLAYLQKHYQINSFDELTDQSDSIDDLPVGELKGTLPSYKFKTIYFGTEKDGEQKAWDLINTFKVN